MDFSRGGWESEPVSLEQNLIETVGKYHYAIQGVSRKDGKLKPVLYSPERWILEEKGGAWKIVQIQERS